MKTKKSILLFLMGLFLFITGYSQTGSTPPPFFLIHEDQVIPSQDEKYKKTSQELVKLMKDNKFTEMQFSCFALDDFSYWYVSPLSNMAELDKDPFAALSEIAGEEKVKSVFAGFNDTYRSHRDFVAVFHPDLSYNFESLSEPGNNYREWIYVYYEEKYQDDMMQLMKEWKDLYNSKNVPYGYTVYSNGFGQEGPMIVVHSWAKTRDEHQVNNTKIHEILGGEEQKLWMKTKSMLYKVDTKTGYYLAENSYSPDQN